MEFKLTHDIPVIGKLYNYLLMTTALCVKTALKLPMRNLSCKENAQNLYMSKSTCKENLPFLYISPFIIHHS
jgi:hypothetical protein